MPSPHTPRGAATISVIAVTVIVIALTAASAALLHLSYKDAPTPQATATTSAPTREAITAPALRRLPGPVTLTYQGGLCAQGVEGTLCKQIFTVDPDGTWRASDTNRRTRTGTLTQGELMTLIAAVSSTSLHLAPPFTGTCPMEVDGQEVTVAYTDANFNIHNVGSCERDFEDTDPLLLALTDLHAAHSPHN